VRCYRDAAGRLTLVGTARAERMAGSRGADRIWGFGGADTISSGGGNDIVRGGAGGDRVDCGAGRRDRAIRSGPDAIARTCERRN
jgi:Ca2+-binding RTX toxin-like protein